MDICRTDRADELADMARTIWMEYFPTIIDKDETEYILNLVQSEEAIEQQIRDGYLYSFILEDGEKAGYICVRPEEDSLFISKVYVSKEFRGKGLGSKALDRILEMGRSLNSKRAFLRVNRYNELAMGVYKHKGFVIVKEETKDLGNGFCMNDYIMEYRF